jgi:hypothetical protein
MLQDTSSYKSNHPQRSKEHWFVTSDAASNYEADDNVAVAPSSIVALSRDERSILGC